MQLKLKNILIASIVVCSVLGFFLTSRALQSLSLLEDIYPILHDTLTTTTTTTTNSLDREHLERQRVVGTTIITHSNNNKNNNDSNNNQTKKCVCELVSTDCLASIACLPDNPQSESLEMVRGILTRQHLQRTATIKRYAYFNPAWTPMGKSLQYSTMAAWVKWMYANRLPYGYKPHEASDFINATRYPWCQEHNKSGKDCFFSPLNHSEDFDENSLEQRALGRIGPTLSTTISPQPMDLQWLRETPLGQLLSFAHINRLLFHRTPPVRQAYLKQVRRIVHINNSNNGTTQLLPPLRVSVHMRRADACNHEKMDRYFESEASPLNSTAQFSGVRKCYQNKVYMDALQRVETLAGGRPLDIYLSSDDADNVMGQIKKSYPKLYDKWNWNYLGHSRDIFKYQGFIEWDENTKKDVQGEASMGDFWHLSHGQVFVGNLGSRFAKMGYSLATARHNTFIPFMTVDGHALCCEIDENCAAVKPYIVNMENCLSFAHELAELKLDLPAKVKDEYWKKGSQIRQLWVENPTLPNNVFMTQRVSTIWNGI